MLESIALEVSSPVIKRRLALLAVPLLLLLTPARSQDTHSPSKAACLEKEISDSTRLLFADGGRMKIGFLVEQITWSDDYRRAAADVIRGQFSNNFVAAGDQTLGTLVLYISGTSAVSNGAQYVGVRLQINSGELLLPENGNSFADLHLAKLGDPVRSMNGQLVFAEDGVLLPPIEQGMPFELWHQLNVEQVRKKVQAVLSQFVADWDKAGKK
jgi:hypothetical protein